MTNGRPDLEQLFDRPEACEPVRELLSMFTNRCRLRIFCRLSDGEANVGELVEASGERQPLVSQQLRNLRLAGLIDRRRDGSRNVYRISSPHVHRTMAFVRQLAADLHLERPDD